MVTSAESQDGSEIVLNGVLASRVCPYSGLLRHTFGKPKVRFSSKHEKTLLDCRRLRFRQQP